MLAYLVRRLLENGANSSFVHQIVNKAVAPEIVAACPFVLAESWAVVENPRLKTGANLFAPRQNSKGWDVTDRADLAAIEVLQKRLGEMAHRRGITLPRGRWWGL